ncbi:hypothetical protein V6U90_33205 [Micromonospora sp. CPCC 206060]|uniref:hypothetical protein n=1 Tax=Micromonospora sp. CPCC 206060 TaxID=3122406 RepID=UPI002FF20EE9
MTETVVLVVDDRTVDLGKLAEFVQSVGDVSVNGAVLTLQRGDEHCYVVEVSDPEVDGIFEDWPEVQVPKSPSAIFSVDYRAPDLVVALVHSIAQRCSLTVDTNYGQVVSGGGVAPDMLRPM